MPALRIKFSPTDVVDVSYLANFVVSPGGVVVAASPDHRSLYSYALSQQGALTEIARVPVSGVLAGELALTPTGFVLANEESGVGVYRLGSKGELTKGPVGPVGPISPA